MKRLILIAAILAALACAASVWSQGARPGGPGGPGAPAMSCAATAVMPPHVQMIDHMVPALHLSKDQTAKLKKIVSTNGKKMRSLEQSAANASRALHASLLSSKYSAKNTKALAAKAEKAEAALIAASIDEWTQIHSVLTAKQSAALQRAMPAERPGPAGPPPGFPPYGGPAPKGAR